MCFDSTRYSFPRASILLVAGLACHFFSGVQIAQADTFVWTPTGSFTWLSPPNWVNTSIPPTSMTGVPGAGDSAVFVEGAIEPTVLLPQVPGGTTVQQLTVESGSYAFDLPVTDPITPLNVTGSDGFVVGSASGFAFIGWNGTFNTNGTVLGIGAGSDGTIYNGRFSTHSDTNQIVVGDSGRGSYVLEGAVATTTGQVIIGDEASGVGSVSVFDDAYDLPTVYPGELHSQGWMLIGNYGDAALDVVNGGNVFATDVILLAVGPDSQGTANVGSGGTLSTNNSTLVGGGWWQTGGHGTLNINAGGTSHSNQGLEIALYTGSVGEVNVAGMDARAESRYVTVANNGQATLTVEDGGMVSVAEDLAVAVSAGGQGTVRIDDGGTITAANAYVGGAWWGAGGTGVLNVTDGGTLDVGHQLKIWGNPGNEVNLGGGTIEASNVVVGEGAELNGHGWIEAHVENGGLVSPGPSIGMLHMDGYTQTSTGRLRIELAPGDISDTLNINGNAFLAGTLDVIAPEGYSPTGTAFFPILNPVLSLGTVTGTFSTINLPTFAGYSWDTSFLYTVGVLLLESETELPGDFDLDGDVDGRDFLVWQRNPSLGDLIDWQAGYGGGALAGVRPTLRVGAHDPARNTAVPEPGAFVLLFSISMSGLLRRGSLFS